MISGIVTADREAIVRLHLRGTSGLGVDVEAVLDTGFTEYLSLPPVSCSHLRQLTAEHLRLTPAGNRP
jgi:predicted aspartyl protease